MEQLGISAIHPNAPEFISAVALFSAPIDIDAAIVRLRQMWSIAAAGSWQTVSPDPSNPDLIAGELYQFTEQGVTALLTGVNEKLDLGGAPLPEHVFHLPITLYAPQSAATQGTLASEDDVTDTVMPEIKLRRRMVSAHILLTQIIDALMEEPAAVGVFRGELGIVQPPKMIHELSENLTTGRVPLPLWVNIRTAQDGLSMGRTLGLANFGHLDLEVRESTKSADDVYLLLSDIASYLISGDTYLLPGQTLGGSTGEKLPLTEEISPFDKAPVIRVMY